MLDNRDFGFSMKLDLLSAFRVIPEHILLCADVVRLIRNEFAHNLELESLENISKRSANKLVSYYENTPSIGSATGIKTKNLFESVVDIATMGIRAYEYNIRLFKETVNSKTFLSNLEQIGTERTEQTKQKPLGNEAVGHGSLYTKKKNVNKVRE
jgi:hypothetical protein